VGRPAPQLQAARDARPGACRRLRRTGVLEALRDVFADTKEQRCWWHKIGNVLAALPKSAHKDAKAALAEIHNAEDRDHVTKGPGSRAAGIAMAFKLIESAQHRWRAVNSAHPVALVRAGAKFENGVLVERPDESASGDTHAA
jgi:lipid A disaccharide synthetase